MMRTDTHPGVYVSLLVAYRGLYGLNWIYRAYNEPWYIHHPIMYAAATVHVGMYVVFMVDRKCRCAVCFFLGGGHCCCKAAAGGAATALYLQVWLGRLDSRC